MRESTGNTERGRFCIWLHGRGDTTGDLEGRNELQLEERGEDKVFEAGVGHQEGGWGTECHPYDEAE